MTGPVRPGRPADRPALCALRTHLPEHSPPLLGHCLRAGGVLVSTRAGRPVGSLLAVGPVDLRTDDPPPGAGAHVAELVVLPDARREGRAGALLDALAARTAGPLTVRTTRENEAALACYRSRGFAVVAREGETVRLRRPADRPS